MSTLTRDLGKAQSCVDIVCQTPYSAESCRIASQAGLNINSVSWEDNARVKDSCFGPCISDMTLSVEGRDMPLIKNTSNFEDETWDVELENIPLVVGNEDGTMLRTVTLREYLSNFRDYLHNPAAWPGTQKSLLVEGKDQHAIVSAQACFLPMPAEGDAKFNVAIYNYQSMPADPAVLAIVASANGTSAQVLDSGSIMHLYHNNNGQRASFIGQRLSKYRRETGSDRPVGAPMSESEKQQNMLLIIQVPLKQKMINNFRTQGFLECCSSSDDCCDIDDECEDGDEGMLVDVESAIIKVGEDEGPFAEINNIEIERDERFPIRVTLQYYKATSNGAVNAAVMDTIAKELQAARKWAVAISSLVTETTNRTTEHVNTTKSASPSIVPAWWPAFWAQYGSIYGSWSANAAQAKLFGPGNYHFSNAKLEDVREQILDILGKDPVPA